MHLYEPHVAGFYVELPEVRAFRSIKDLNNVPPMTASIVGQA